MIDELTFLDTHRAGTNAAEASVLKWWILNHLQKGPCDAQTIYELSECGDQAMYLALHELVNNKLIEGLSPFDTELRGTSHREWVYWLADNDSAKFFAGASISMSERWDPDEWNIVGGRN